MIRPLLHDDIAALLRVLKERLEPHLLLLPAPSQLDTRFFGAWLTNQYYQSNPEKDGLMEDIGELVKGAVNRESLESGE